MTDDSKQGLHNQIVQLLGGGSSIRGIARQLGISRHQVARVLAAHRMLLADCRFAAVTPLSLAQFCFLGGQIPRRTLGKL